MTKKKVVKAAVNAKMPADLITRNGFFIYKEKNKYTVVNPVSPEKDVVLFARPDFSLPDVFAHCDMLANPQEV